MKSVSVASPGATFRQGFEPLRHGPLAGFFLLNVLNSTRQFGQHAAPARRREPFRRQFGPTKARYRFVDHHSLMRFSSYCYSGSTMPRWSSWTAAAPGRQLHLAGSKGRVEHVLTINWPNSLGLFYARSPASWDSRRTPTNGRLMGLAPYGQPGADLRMFLETDATPYRDSRRSPHR